MRGLLGALLLCTTLAAQAQPEQFDIQGPAGSGAFGTRAVPLSNGNIVVIDPHFSDGNAQDIGAIYLYSESGALISVVTGSTAGDAVGSRGIWILSTGNFVVVSQAWGDSRGAVTFVDAAVGVSGVVSAQNSLVGTVPGQTTGDRVGSNGIIMLTNGHYLVQSDNWNNGAALRAGAVTWCNGTMATVGEVSPQNSLVGSTTDERLGANSGTRGTIALANGNYVVPSSGWDNGAVLDAGAATWGNGTGGTTGPITAANSLVGTSAGSNVGGGLLRGGITALSNGHYVVRSPAWKNGDGIRVGAITWGNGDTGSTGPVSASNSLVGSTIGDDIGSYVNFGPSLTELANGNYVIHSAKWDNGAMVDAGAATWASGTSGVTGTISAANSLIGSHAGDRIGQYGAAALPNGNYVVGSFEWDNGSIVDAGAITHGNGTTGTAGVVSAQNSLVGTSADDHVSVRVLANGHFVAVSSSWDNGAVPDVGAVMWIDSPAQMVGTISASNSLIGVRAGDRIGYSGIALPNGNLVIRSPYWDREDGLVDVGAVTWVDGSSPFTGVVSSANSLVGGATDDFQYTGITMARSGGYFLSTPYWDNGASVDAGAVTRLDGNTGLTGVISSANSIVGTTAGDQVGYYVTRFANGNLLLTTPSWDKGALVDAGALTWLDGRLPTSGVVTAANSFTGTISGDKPGVTVDMFDNLLLSTREQADGMYYFTSALWDNGAVPDAGAITWMRSDQPALGEISAANSFLGSTTDATDYINVNYDATHRRLVFGVSNENFVRVVTLPVEFSFGDGFE